MLSLPPSVRIFVYTAPADMRKSFSGLSALVEQHMRLDSLSGHLFVFRNRRADKLKALYWDRDGYALWYKRLERGTFPLTLPADASEEPCHIEMRPSELSMLLDGVDVARVKRQRRWERAPSRRAEPVENPASASH
jgi:transposase